MKSLKHLMTLTAILAAISLAGTARAAHVDKPTEVRAASDIFKPGEQKGDAVDYFKPSEMQGGLINNERKAGGEGSDIPLIKPADGGMGGWDKTGKPGAPDAGGIWFERKAGGMPTDQKGLRSLDKLGSANDLLANSRSGDRGNGWLSPHIGTYDQKTDKYPGRTQDASAAGAAKGLNYSNQGGIGIPTDQKAAGVGGTGDLKGLNFANGSSGGTGQPPARTSPSASSTVGGGKVLVINPVRK